MTIGSVFVLIFWQAMATADNGRGSGPIKGAPPQAIAYLNPFLAQVDVLCGTETTFGGWCSIENGLLQNQNGVVFRGRAGAGADAADRSRVQPRRRLRRARTSTSSPVTSAPFGVARDAFWPKSVVTWLIVSLVLLLLTVQFVSPTRRWRLRRGRRPPPAPAP